MGKLTFEEITAIVNDPTPRPSPVSDIFAKAMAKILDEQQRRKAFMASLEELTQQIETLAARRDELFKLKEPIDAELVSSHELLQNLKNKRDTLLLPEKENDWEWLLRSDLEGASDVCHKACKQQLEKIGLMDSGSYNGETNQRMVRIALTKNDGESFESTLRGLEIVLPFIRPMKDGYKMIDIFEHTLSRHDIYFLKVKEGEFAITTHRSYGEVKTYPTLREALAHIQAHLWYKKK